MTEDYLHQLWKNKRIPFHELEPINASKIEVKDVGQHNENQKGPDFTFGAVKIDGIDFYGNIEIHVKSSDWYKHKHDKDGAYNNVVLHVVYEYDKPVVQNGVLLPTLELKSHLDQAHFQMTMQGLLRKNDLPCSKVLSKIDSIYLESMKMKAYYDRLNAKSNLLIEMNLPDPSVFYHLLAAAFGTSINKQAFVELARKITFFELKQLQSKKQQFQLLVAESGLIQNGGGGETTNLWHFKGTRPGNFPDVRLKQFAQFVSKYDFNYTYFYLNADQIKKEFYKLVDDFWSNDSHSSKITRPFSNLLIINAVVPFMWYIGVINEDERMQSKAIELLELLPREKNKYVNMWLKCPIEIKNAFDSQSLLSLYQYYCNHKKCLTCSVGIKSLEV